MKPSMGWIIVVVLGVIFITDSHSYNQLILQASMETHSLIVSRSEADEPSNIWQEAAVSALSHREQRSGEVSLSPGASSYAQGSAITAIIRNGLERAIYAEDLMTDCSVVIMEHWSPKGWQAMLNCGMERLPATMVIMAGQILHVTLDPRSSHFEMSTGVGDFGLSPGTYRFRFGYRFNPGLENEEKNWIISQEFVVTP